MTRKDVIHGDSREVLKTLDADSLDSCCTDPPYHLTSIVKRFGKTTSAECQFGTDGAYKRAATGFMGMEWDGGDIAFDPTFWAEVLRVLKPGAHLVAFGGDRTYHRLACAIEDAGFEIRQCIAYHFASGFPKNHDVSKGIDRMNGHKRPVVGLRSKIYSYGVCNDVFGGGPDHNGVQSITDAASEQSAEWSGWGTALKPATELICLARKPLSESSVARNVLRHRTGAINIDASRIHCADSQGQAYQIKRLKPGATLESEGGTWRDSDGVDFDGHTQNGRWPANLILGCSCEGAHEEGCPVRQMDEQSGTLTSGEPGVMRLGVNNSGASRFFFTAKPCKAERGEKNLHPTVKPVSLMRYLTRLVTPPGGIVLDPFTGSGTTAVACEIEGFGYVAIEREAKYVEIIKGRTGKAFQYADDEQKRADGQISLFD